MNHDPLLLWELIHSTVGDCFRSSLFTLFQLEALEF